MCANLAEAWRKRRYKKLFAAKLSDCESEAAETQVWLEFAVKYSYADRDQAKTIYLRYDEILRLIVSMINHPEIWVIGHEDKTIHEDSEEYYDLF